MAEETKEGRSSPLGATVLPTGQILASTQSMQQGSNSYFLIVLMMLGRACDLDRSRDQPDLSLLAHFRTGDKSRADLRLSS